MKSHYYRYRIENDPEKDKEYFIILYITKMHIYGCGYCPHTSACKMCGFLWILRDTVRMGKVCLIRKFELLSSALILNLHLKYM